MDYTQDEINQMKWDAYAQGRLDQIEEMRSLNPCDFYTAIVTEKGDQDGKNEF